MKFSLLLFVTLVFSSVAFTAPTSVSSLGKRDTATIDNAISQGMSYLRNAQLQNGAWRNGPGTTALVLQAIVNNGVPEGYEEAINKAIEYLLTEPQFDKVYESATLAMALQALDSNKYKDVIAKCAEFLGSSQLPTGMWTYRAIPEEQWNTLNEKFQAQQASIARPGRSTNNNLLPPSLSPGDNSNTQFALLGLRAARRAGISVNMDAVRACQEHFMRSQNENGGWGYAQYDRNPRGSMTCAAIGSLCILDDELKSGSYFTRRKIKKNNVAKGIQWMRDNFSVTTNPGYKSNYLYYMYSMERAAALSGHKQFGEHDWFAESWPVLCEAQRSDGSWCGARAGRSSDLSDTAFVVLFLKKAQKYHGVKPLASSN